MSNNVLRQFVGAGGWGEGVLVLLTFGAAGGRGVVQNRESPDFRSPEVGRYECMTKNFAFPSGNKAKIIPPPVAK